ncbi:enolase C-terminal domain-like protein [Amycolatopsis rubida]|uniref:enolase C-terminal domain-like protein n=1 Tax=Amycolatopsis rubida TaxID=112413 RepID=UPI001FCBEC68|nr:enolase C-terminal domain-like protein [Amycolatopsis rubida]
MIHGEVCKWGGIAATKALAAHLAVVASTPVLSRAIDSMHYLHADDIVEPLRLSGGRLRVLAGPGLGVEVDEEKLAFYAAKNEREGDLAG